jgi:hypothetical protein
VVGDDGWEADVGEERGRQAEGEEKWAEVHGGEGISNQ